MIGGLGGLLHARCIWRPERRHRARDELLHAALCPRRRFRSPSRAQAASRRSELVVIGNGMAPGRMLEHLLETAPGVTKSRSSDQLFRTTNANQPPVTAETRAEVTRLLLRSAGRGELWRLTEAVLRNLLRPAPGSHKRMRKSASMKCSQHEAAADRARKVGIVLGFLTASILLIGAVSAWWAAAVGGRHRDEGTVWPGLGEIKGF